MGPAVSPSRAALRRGSYLGVLAGCALATLPLEVGLGVRVYRRPGRVLAAVAPVAAAFLAWDVAALRAGWWTVDDAQTCGVRLGALPLEEALFFLVVPTCAVATLEAVRARRPAWPV